MQSSQTTPPPMAITSSHHQRSSQVQRFSHIQPKPMQSHIEYLPYEKTIIEYEPVTRVEYIPREKKVVEYYPVEYQTEYIPQVYQEKVIEYVPVERLEERVEYVPVERQIYYPPQEQPYYDEQDGGVGRPSPIKSSYPTQIMSRIQPAPANTNMSFQNPGELRAGSIPASNPMNNSVYTKEPLPSSKRYTSTY